MLILIGSDQEVEEGGSRLLNMTGAGYITVITVALLSFIVFLLTGLFVVTFCDKIRGADWWKCD
jgi:hypothetical protein